MDPGRRVVHGRLRRRHPDRGGARSHRARPPASTCPTATATAPGSTPSRSRSAGSPGTRPILPTAGSSATREGEPSGTLHEGAGDLVSVHAPEPTADELAEGASQGPGVPPFARHHGLAGRHRRATISWSNNLDTYMRAATSGDLTARVVGALWWDRHRRAWSRSMPSSTQRARRRGGALRRHQRQDHAGRRLRELHGGGAESLPRRPRRRRPTTAASPSSTRSC